MMTAYYNIGQRLVERDTWGSKFIESLAKDLKIELPNVKCLSSRNLRYMKKLALTYDVTEFLPQGVKN